MQDCIGLFLPILQNTTDVPFPSKLYETKVRAILLSLSWWLLVSEAIKIKKSVIVALTGRPLLCLGLEDKRKLIWFVFLSFGRHHYNNLDNPCRTYKT